MCVNWTEVDSGEVRVGEWLSHSCLSSCPESSQQGGVGNGYGAFATSGASTEDASSTSLMSSSTDSKTRLLVEPFNGQRGPVFTKWAKGYLDAAAGGHCGDEDASYAECYLGTDPQAGLSAAQDRRRKQRRRESYSTLLQHISDESLKAVIRAEAGPGAANQADRLNGRTAWLTLERECQEPMSALHINTKIIEFNGLTIDRKSTRLNSSHTPVSRMPSSA